MPIDDHACQNHYCICVLNKHRKRFEDVLHLCALEDSLDPSHAWCQEDAMRSGRRDVKASGSPADAPSRLHSAMHELKAVSKHAMDSSRPLFWLSLDCA